MKVTGSTNWLVEIVDGLLSVSSEPGPDWDERHRAALKKVASTERVS
ncbi:hypothetical protein [Devosia sp.]